MHEIVELDQAGVDRHADELAQSVTVIDAVGFTVQGDIAITRHDGLGRTEAIAFAAVTGRRDDHRP